MSKHTPGPWEANRWKDEDADIYGWSFSAGGYLLPLSDMETDDPAICDANARLIAAAPLMLGVLQKIIESVPFTSMHWRTRNEVIDAVRAATGEQP